VNSGVFIGVFIMADTIFGKIARGETETELIYEDEVCVAFRDIAPVAPVHLLVIPREPFEDATQTDESTLGRVMHIAAKLGREHCPNGFRLVINTGKEAG